MHTQKSTQTQVGYSKFSASRDDLSCDSELRRYLRIDEDSMKIEERYIENFFQTEDSLFLDEERKILCTPNFIII